MKGWVYLITNPSIEKLIKIGYTLKDPDLRAKELRNTGTPLDYKVEYEILCSNPRRTEKAVHNQLDSHRIDREWFNCDLNTAIEAVRKHVSGKIYYENTRNTSPSNVCAPNIGEKIESFSSIDSDLSDVLKLIGSRNNKTDMQLGVEVLRKYLDVRIEKMTDHQISLLVRIANSDLTNFHIMEGPSTLSDSLKSPDVISDVRMDLAWFYIWERKNYDCAIRMCELGSRKSLTLYHSIDFSMKKVFALASKGRLIEARNQLGELYENLANMPEEADGSIFVSDTINEISEMLVEFPLVTKHIMK